MISIANKYSAFLITCFVFAPLLAYVSFGVIGIAFETLMQLLTFVGVFLVLIFRKKDSVVRIPNYLKFYFLFTLYVFYSDLVMLNRPFKWIYLFSNSLIGGLNMMFILENVNISKKHFKFILKWSTYILIVAIIVILLQQTVNKNIFVDTSKFVVVNDGASNTEDRLHSIYSWINLLGNGFGFVPVFLIVVENIYRNNKLIFFWIVFGLTYALLTKDRWILLNAFLVFFLLIVNRKNKFLRLVKLGLIVPVLAIISYVGLNLIGLNVDGVIKDRILESDKSLHQKSAGTRIIAFHAFNRFFWENPIFGKGNVKYGMGHVSGKNKWDYELRSFLKGRSSQIHVGYLSLFYMYGLIGGMLFMTFLFLIMRQLYLDAKLTTYWGPFLGFTGFALANLTLVSFSIFEMGLIICLFVNKYYLSLVWENSHNSIEIYE